MLQIGVFKEGVDEGSLLLLLDALVSYFSWLLIV